MTDIVCPQCQSPDLEDADDATFYPEEIHHDFVCLNCGAVIEIVYQPISVRLISGDKND